MLGVGGAGGAARTGSDWRRSTRGDRSPALGRKAVLDAGWHLSSFGGVDAVARKLEAYIEAPIYNTSFYTATSSSSSASTAATGPSGPGSTGASTAATTTASAARRPTPRGRTTRRCAPRATRSSGRARTSSRSRRSPRTTP